MGNEKVNNCFEKKTTQGTNIQFNLLFVYILNCNCLENIYLEIIWFTRYIVIWSIIMFNTLYFRVQHIYLLADASVQAPDVCNYYSRKMEAGCDWTANYSLQLKTSIDETEQNQQQQHQPHERIVRRKRNKK